MGVKSMGMGGGIQKGLTMNSTIPPETSASSTRKQLLADLRAALLPNKETNDPATIREIERLTNELKLFRRKMSSPAI